MNGETSARTSMSNNESFQSQQRLRSRKSSSIKSKPRGSRLSTSRSKSKSKRKAKPKTQQPKPKKQFKTSNLPASKPSSKSFQSSQKDWRNFWVFWLSLLVFSKAFNLRSMISQTLSQPSEESEKKSKPEPQFFSNNPIHERLSVLKMGRR